MAFTGIMFNTGLHEANGLASDTITLEGPYRPSSTALEHLENITALQLRGEAHDEGKVVRLREVEGRTFTSTTKTVFATTGFPMSLEISHANPTLVRHRLLSRPKVVLAINEPFFTRSEHAGFVLRLDHLSDMLLLHLPHRPAPQFFKHTEPLFSLPSAPNLKNFGNKLLKQGKPLAAEFVYTHALHTIKDTDVELKLDLHRTRAEARLRLGPNDGAKGDALLAVIDAADERSLQLNGNAFYRAGRASYELCDYNRAIALATPQLNNVPGDGHGEALIMKAKSRLHEQVNGEYNVAAMLPAPDAASPYVTAEIATPNQSSIGQALDVSSRTLSRLEAKSGSIFPSCIPSDQDIKDAQLALDCVEVAYEKAESRCLPLLVGHRFSLRVTLQDAAGNRQGTLKAHGYLMHAYKARGEYQNLVKQLSDYFAPHATTTSNWREKTSGSKPRGTRFVRKPRRSLSCSRCRTSGASLARSRCRCSEGSGEEAVLYVQWTVGLIRYRLRGYLIRLCLMAEKLIRDRAVPLPRRASP